jgi:hypothetical protein
MGLLETLYISGDIERPDGRQRQSAILAPAEEPAARLRVGASRVWVENVGGGEFDKAPAGGFAGVGDKRRHQDGGVGVDRARECTGRCDDRWKVVRLVG